ncbi:urea ABC transporter permease subunit UrtB [Methylocaldum sp.]|uniref:urea ABC transporter permease subunit UrtB n=1 Tax=Methylocaldum sp. TaxID=1969727 RepID=UPI002D4FC02B|nr:urea ABC transporter permease subunit UrtB [Methylocaldum sp.]HYE37233.1 urea ABC transporter permease subunit UrtB [Methylocaldum sp.]
MRPLIFSVRRWGVVMLSMMMLGLCEAAAGSGDPFADALARLKEVPLNEMGEVVERIAGIKDSRTVPVLRALLDGRLYYRKDDGAVVFGDAAEDGLSIVNVLDGQAQGTVAKFDLKKISINNALRTTLRETLGRLELTVEDPVQRLKAVEAMSQSLDEKSVGLLRAQLDVETDPKVSEAIGSVLALADLSSDDKNLRIRAIDALHGNLRPDVFNRLNELLEKDEEGRYLEPDSDIRNSAQVAIKTIESKLTAYRAAETVFFGLSLGAVLVLASIGLAITFGVMGVINMAHGELMMLGAYTTYVVQQLMPGHLDISLFVAIPAAFLLSALVGIAIERGIIRFLYGRPLETLLATFGVSLFLQQLVRTIFSPLNRSVATPAWMSGSVEINGALSLTLNRFYILVFCLLVFAALLQILKRSRIGLEVRAVAQNRAMAKAMGIPTERVDALTFGLGSGIAGVAGVALSQLTNVGPNLGQSYIVDSFMVVVFGGVGNLWGTLIGGFSLGIANKLLEPYSGAVLAKILMLVFIIVFIQKRPRGLFPQKGRAAEA